MDVTTARLNKITELFDSGKLVASIGTVLPLEDARIAHEMLVGRPDRRGKIVLDTGSRREELLRFTWLYDSGAKVDQRFGGPDDVQCFGEFRPIYADIRVSDGERQY